MPSRKITIGGQAFRLIFKEMDDFGQMAFDDRKIYIAKRCIKSDKLFRETLRHEMIHAALHIGGVAYLDNYDEEAVVRCLENIFFPAWDEVTKQLS